MRIKQLELKGFKSFRNRTVIRFNPGTNCIVGPNGCGKSNVVDAFLWVMGETAPTHLRSSSMEDVIFAGTNKYPPSGVAEVSLVIEKAEKKNTFPNPYSSFSEVMLTRRLDRDGKSEYLINSRPCRLKDVQEVFMDTGMGVHGFSFIEQGEVEHFISSKPEQKHLLIESAAGISKFRSRKKEAEKKLDLTENHLKRLKDILYQQNSQLEKLNKQSKKTALFRSLKEKIREKDIQVSVWDLNHIRKENQQLNKQVQEENVKNENLQKEVHQIQSQLEHWRKTQENNKVQIAKVEQELESIKGHFLSVEKEEAGLKASIQTNKEYLAHSESSSGEQNHQVILNQIGEIEKNIVQCERKKEDISEKWNRVKKEYEALSEEYFSLKEKKQSLKTEMVNYKHQEVLFHQQNQSVVSAIQNWIQREQEWKNLLEEKHKEVRKLQSQKKLLTDKLDKRKQLSFNVTDSIQDLKRNIESLERESQKQESEIKKKQMDASALYSEWNSLKKLNIRMDAFEKGLRFLIQSVNEKDKFLETAVSLRLSSPSLEQAVASYMELRLKSIFCRDSKAALSAIALLNEKKAGRCRFLLPSAVKLSSESKLSKKIEKEPGFQFFLKNNIEGDKELIDLLFSQTAVVENIDTAMRLKAKYLDWCLITLKGEVLTPEGDIIGGEINTEEMNILAYKRVMEEMPVQYETMKKQTHSMELQLREVKSFLQKNKDKLSQLNERKGKCEISVLGISKDLKIVQRDQDRLVQEISQVQKKVLECQKGRQELQSKKDSFQKDFPSAKKNDLQITLKQVESECVKREQEKQTMSMQKDHFWQAGADCEKELVSMKERRTLLTQSLEREKQKERNNLFHLKEKGLLIRDYEKKLQTIEQKKRLLNGNMEDKTTQVMALNQEQEKLIKQINDNQSCIIKLHQARVEKESVINHLKLQVESLGLQKDSLVEKVKEKYRVDLESLEEVKKLDFNRDEEEQILQKMRNQLSRIGEVNLLAVKEYEDLMQENQFYQKQYEDLCTSKEKLSQVIKRIDGFCAKKFNEVFEQVNSCFSRVWPALFEGGKAELILVKDSKKGVEGMDIMVQPPGKKIQSMSLLSGGEKAMTAVAVIFSIFLVKPSPFCILDEVDAPLDDVNITRFNSLLSEMAAVSQVVVITHNKYTMQECEHLYGVTMEEKGISKVVSLDMKSVHVDKTNPHTETSI